MSQLIWCAVTIETNCTLSLVSIVAAAALAAAVKNAIKQFSVCGCTSCVCMCISSPMQNTPNRTSCIAIAMADITFDTILFSFMHVVSFCATRSFLTLSVDLSEAFFYLRLLLLFALPLENRIVSIPMNCAFCLKMRKKQEFSSTFSLAHSFLRSSEAILVLVKSPICSCAFQTN